MTHLSFSYSVTDSYNNSVTEKTENWIQEKPKNEKISSSFTIKNIKIIGKTKYDPVFISNLSCLYPGDKIEIPGKEIDNAIKKLWDTNLFKTISIYKKNTNPKNKNEIDLFFDLEDSIKVNQINLEGNGKTQFETIKKIHSGDKISDHLIQSIHNEIEDYYLKKGYKDISIKKEFISTKKENENILNIHVYKGKKTWIENIFFSGNQILNEKELLNLIVKTRNKFSIPFIEKTFCFVYENINDDLKNIIRKYQSMGFLDVKVFLDSIWKEKSGNYSIKIKVVEGKRYYLGNVKFVGNTFFNDSFLKNILSYKKGDIYDKIGINNNIFNSFDEFSILSNYLNFGFFFVKIVPIEKKIVNNQIHLEIEIEENKPVYINKVKISGNTITKDHIIRRELTTYPGNTFSPKEIKSSLLHLNNLNLFERINPFILINRKNNTLDIEWRVVEKGANQIQLHGGYEKRKIFGNLKLIFGNFSIINFFKWKSWNPIPQGNGQKLLLFNQFGKDKQSYGFSFTEPWIEKTNPTSLTFEMHFSKKKIKNDENISFFTKKFNLIPEGFLEEKKIGSSINLNKFLTFFDPYSKIELSMHYDKFFYKNLVTDVDLKKNHSFQLNNLSYLISLQRFYGVPDLIYPVNGSKIQLSSIFTIPYSILFNKKFDWIEFFKLKIISFGYKKIVDNVVIKFGGEFGILGKYNNSSELLSSQKFYMGGTGGRKLEDKDLILFRGYNHTEFLPPVNGGIIYNKYLFEVRYLIKKFSYNMSKFWTFLFIEEGCISDSYKKFNPLRMNKSFGFGFRIFLSPIGLFGIDFGYPINSRMKKDSFLSRWKTHFIIGQD